MAPKAKTLGALIDEGAKLDERLAQINKQLREAKAEKSELQEAIIAALEEQGIEQSAGKTHTATLTEEEVFQVEDWESFYRFVLRSKAPYLMQRRLATPAMRELAEQRTRAIPGVQKVPNKKLSFRKRPAKK